MSSLLERIVAYKRWEVATRKRLLGERELRERVGIVPRARDLAAALRRGPAPRVVAEVKRASPSRGAIRPGADAAQVACEYAENGAAAISVLTDTRFFGGCIEDLWRVREAVSVPALRKDFLVDPYQLFEARAYGADGVLLLCSALDDAQLADLASLARELGMTAVVEAHAPEEVDRALRVEAPVVGLNNRDLRTMTVVEGHAIRLRAHVPSDRIALAESGVKSRRDIEALLAAGLDACLVGESLMSAESPGAALRALLAR
jgi:indole-3-glycerol phosphate synthase